MERTCALSPRDLPITRFLTSGTSRLLEPLCPPSDIILFLTEGLVALVFISFRPGLSILKPSVLSSTCYLKIFVVGKVG